MSSSPPSPFTPLSSGPSSAGVGHTGMSPMPGTLYLVATPIGNLADMTYRAVEMLRAVSAIACEDTRHTRKLLDHYDIERPLLSYHEHNEAERALALLQRLRGGGGIALVSDARWPRRSPA